MSDWFDRAAARVSVAVGHWYAFGAALLLIVAWLATGVAYGVSDTWQLVINTTTTIVTFLMVFLIQNTQNRNDLAMHVKLDELIRVMDKADNRFRHIERAEHLEEQVEALEEEVER